MRQLVYTVTAENDGVTVEALLYANGIGRRLTVRLKQTPDGLCVAGERVRSTRVLHAGETLTVTLPAPETVTTRGTIPIIYRDEDIIVCDKPAGMACHRSGGHIDDTLESAVGERPLRLIGRLDKDTSGVLVLGRHQLAASRLHGHIEKHYIAVAGGTLPEKEGDITLPLERAAAYEPLQTVTPDGAPCRTYYRVLWQGEGMSLVLCTPVTGRMHQIRAHLAAVGAPLLGDALYGGDCGRIKRQALHCRDAAFTHPFGGKSLRFCAPLPQDMQNLLPDDALTLIEVTKKNDL